jgi:tripartite-type tricarboxylate transporter receptor subunit TctC
MGEFAAKWLADLNIKCLLEACIESNMLSVSQYFFEFYRVFVRRNHPMKLMKCAIAMVCAGTVASAMAYPTKPISLVVPFAAGGPTDVVARTLAASMTKTLGQSVVVENKPGAGGTIASAYVKNAANDGHVLLIHHNGMATAPALYRKLAFNPLTDFETVGLTVDVPMTLVTRKDMPAKNVPELIAYIKANKDKVSLANAGLGAVSHLCGAIFQQAIGVDLTTIPFQGTGPAMTNLVGGQVDMLCDQTTSTIPQIKGDKIKLYGVTTKTRISALPNTPTLAEQGMKDFEVVVWHGVYAPKGTPKDAIMKVNAALQTALKDADVLKRMSELAAEITPLSKQTPEAHKAWLASETDKWGKVIKAAGQYAD